MKKELAVAADAAADLGTPVVLWSLLVGELVINSLLLLSDKLPPVLFRSLQLFLRF